LVARKRTLPLRLIESGHLAVHRHLVARLEDDNVVDLHLAAGDRSFGAIA
jgi:hypothetical protein